MYVFPRLIKGRKNVFFFFLFDLYENDDVVFSCFAFDAALTGVLVVAAEPNAFRNPIFIVPPGIGDTVNKFKRYI